MADLMLEPYEAYSAWSSKRRRGGDASYIEERSPTALSAELQPVAIELISDIAHAAAPTQDEDSAMVMSDTCTWFVQVIVLWHPESFYRPR
jgi:hypothetical protein